MTDLVASRKGFDGKWLNAELREILRRADPTAWQSEADGELRVRVRQVVGYLRAQLASSNGLSADGAPSYRERLIELLATIERATPTEATRSRWAAFLKDVHPVYEAARQQLPELAATRAVRPTNLTRSFFHMTSATVAFLTISFVPSHAWLVGIAVAFGTYAWSMEIGRRFSPRMNAWLMKLYGPVAHAHERHQVNSATWYATALLVLAIFYSKFGALAGVAVLGLADPIAALVGRRWGRIRVIAGRTVEGSLAFALTAFITCVAAGTTLHAFAWGELFLVSAVAAVVGAIVELVSGPVDDNLTIPVAVGAAVTLMCGL